VTEETILFHNAHSALVFAFNFSGQCYDRPMMNRMATPSVGTGKGLVGLDGAAQAGMILAELAAMGKLAEAIMTARLAPRHTPCECRSPCCSGRKPNKDWTDAIGYLSDYVRTTALAGCTANGILRREYVVRYFSRKDERVSLEDLAERYDVDRHTTSAHASKVAVLFGGHQAKKGAQAAPGLESVAMEAIEHRLREVGMVGSPS
jgi:hypothetical protein